jgi:hypothetical protein
MTQTQDQHGEQDQYVVAKALEILANDDRLAETALHVSVTGPKMFITGDVATAERRDAITAVLTESFPDHEIANATSIYDMVETTEEETL